MSARFQGIGTADGAGRLQSERKRLCERSTAFDKIRHLGVMKSHRKYDPTLFGCPVTGCACRFICSGWGSQNQHEKMTLTSDTLDVLQVSMMICESNCPMGQAARIRAKQIPVRTLVFALSVPTSFPPFCRGVGLLKWWFVAATEVSKTDNPSSLPTAPLRQGID